MVWCWSFGFWTLVAQLMHPPSWRRSREPWKRPSRSAMHMVPSLLISSYVGLLECSANTSHLHFHVQSSSGNSVNNLVQPKQFPTLSCLRLTTVPEKTRTTLCWNGCATSQPRSRCVCQRCCFQGLGTHMARWAIRLKRACQATIVQTS